MKALVLRHSSRQQVFILIMSTKAHVHSFADACKGIAKARAGFAKSRYIEMDGYVYLGIFLIQSADNIKKVRSFNLLASMHIKGTAMMAVCGIEGYWSQRGWFDLLQVHSFVLSYFILTV